MSAFWSVERNVINFGVVSKNQTPCWATSHSSPIGAVAEDYTQPKGVTCVSIHTLTVLLASKRLELAIQSVIGLTEDHTWQRDATCSSMLMVSCKTVWLCKVVRARTYCMNTMQQYSQHGSFSSPLCCNQFLFSLLHDKPTFYLSITLQTKWCY